MRNEGKMTKVTIEFVEAENYLQMKTLRLWKNGKEVEDRNEKLAYIKSLKWV